MTGNGVTGHLELGASGESVACDLLKARGMRIVSRNWRRGRLELDIVCRDADTIVFVEVKTRTTAGHGGPLAAVGRDKQRKIILAAQAWLSAHDAWHMPCRFDVVSLVCQQNKFRATHHANAFDISALGRGHATWQPW